MDTELESFKNTLQENGIKPTYLRLKIMNYLETNRVHPTAEAIFKTLAKEIPTLSRTSVYNTLNTFNKNGLLTPLYITGSEANFDSNTNPHHHFLCKKCGKIIDIDIECKYFKDGNILGHKITELHGYYKGICKDCLKRGEGK